MRNLQFIAPIVCFAIFMTKPWTLAENQRIKPEERIEVARETKDSESFSTPKNNGKTKNSSPKNNSAP
jgi:hypothetical protein